jgi:hypothetical protein
LVEAEKSGVVISFVDDVKNTKRGSGNEMLSILHAEVETVIYRTFLWMVFTDML